MIDENKAAKYAEKIIRRKFNIIGEFLIGISVGLVRRDTGLLMGSIGKKISKKGNHIILRIGTDTEYAVYNEFGTGIYAENGNGRKTPWIVTAKVHGKMITFRTAGMKPKPFLRPLLKQEKAIKWLMSNA